jgi:hypothetical protein
MEPGIIILILLFVLYFLPSLVACRRKNANAIFVTNLLFGWTLIGWGNEKDFSRWRKTIQQPHTGATLIDH